MARKILAWIVLVTGVAVGAIAAFLVIRSNLMSGGVPLVVLIPFAIFAIVLVISIKAANRISPIIRKRQVHRPTQWQGPNPEDHANPTRYGL